MSERNIFAVCDLDVDYAYHFMEYLSKKKNIPFEVRVFTSAAGFREYVKEHPVELLLISEKAMNSEIREAKIGQILILSDGVVSKGFEEYPSIYKYQSSNQVIREALEHYGEGVGTTAQTLRLEKKKMEVIGVYSPVGRTMKTTFALTLGQILAKKRACLYLNLEACSGFEYLLERSFDQTLGDLLYYQRLGSEQLITKMGSIVQSVNNLDYLPPVLSMEDIQSTTAQEWISLLQQIIDYSNYDVVILDPPAFTKSREATKNAIKGYREINMKGLKLVKDGGFLATCSCSHFMTQELLAKTVKEAAKATHKRLRQVEFRTQGPDHPILWANSANVPESYYLKFFIFQVVDEK